MMRERLYLLLTIFATPKLALGGSFRIETVSPGLDVCLYCKTDEACKSYAAGSVCHYGQCTNEDGLFGFGCGCSAGHECASGRCEGVFERTCHHKLQTGEACFLNKDCESGRCSKMLICEPPSATNEGMAVSPTENANAASLNENAVAEATDISTATKTCTECALDYECGGGLCMKGLCADKTGKHPPTCTTCRGDGDCIGGYFCHGSLTPGRSGRKCAAMRKNGASCSRNEACESGHCNILFRCESKVPEHERPNTDSSDTPALSTNGQGNIGFPGLAMWASIFLALFVFGACAGVLCQKDGLQRCCLQRLKRCFLTRRSRNRGGHPDTLETSMEEFVGESA